MADGQTRLRVNGREILFPPADITLGEMADAENFFGVDFGNPDKSGVRLMIALLYTAIKRIDQTVTVQDVRDLDPGILEQLAQGDDAGPPDVSSTSSVAENGRSSPSSPGPGDTPQEPIPAVTGSPGSATGSPGSPL
jgi:hypothetical protein